MHPIWPHGDIGTKSLEFLITKLQSEQKCEQVPKSARNAPLDVNEGEEEVDDLLGRELLELVLQDVLQDLEELEAVRRGVVQLAEHSGSGGWRVE